MSMTKAQAGVIAAVTLALAIPLGLQVRSNSKLKSENERLSQLSSQVAALAEENKQLSNRLAAAKSTAAPTADQMSELLKLRGEVGVLRKALKEAPAPEPPPAGQSVLGGITANPEMQKMIRDQQKLGLSMIYRGLGKQADLPEEKVEALNELLADNVMTNINHITQVLKEGKSPAEMEPVFAAQEEALKAQVRQLLGPEAYEKYDEYTRNIASYLTAQQFKGMMSGDNDEKEEKSRQLFELMKEETRIVLENSGLPPDYQTVPTLNFRNIASEQIAEYNLQLLDSIYAKVSDRAGSFLSPQDVEKFAQFRKMAGDNNRVALTVNRKVMMPGAE